MRCGFSKHHWPEYEMHELRCQLCFLSYRLGRHRPARLSKPSFPLYKLEMIIIPNAEGCHNKYSYRFTFNQMGLSTNKYSLSPCSLSLLFWPRFLPRGLLLNYLFFLLLPVQAPTIMSTLLLFLPLFLFFGLLTYSFISTRFLSFLPLY